MPSLVNDRRGLVEMARRAGTEARSRLVSVAPELLLLLDSDCETSSLFCQGEANDGFIIVAEGWGVTHG